MRVPDEAPDITVMHRYSLPSYYICLFQQRPIDIPNLHYTIEQEWIKALKKPLLCASDASTYDLTGVLSDDPSNPLLGRLPNPIKFARLM